MSEGKQGNSAKWRPWAFTGCIVLGIAIGYFLNSKKNFIFVSSSPEIRDDRLDEIVDIIKSKYIDSISMDSLYNDAVNGILQHLDPHTVYIQAKDMQSTKEDLEGKFSGIGIEYTMLQDTVCVTHIIKQGPATLSELAIGDKLIKVNGTLVAGVSVTPQQLTKFLRGETGSEVELEVLKADSRKIETMVLRRGDIPIYSVDAYYMVDSITGYIKINRFSATTYQEFRQALVNLLNQGLQQLILDLRQNPGGYLEAAIQIAEDFLGINKLVIYTAGDKVNKDMYHSKKNGIFEKGGLVVLVDEGSASASEALAGTLQDWDRAVIIGRRTYGKGLVQEEYRLSDGSALRITIAKYYTPSGRSIQRPYESGRYNYSLAYLNRFKDGSLYTYDTLLNNQDTLAFYTQIHKRKMYANGGILPDVITPYDYQFHNAFTWTLLKELPKFTYTYFYEHYQELMQYGTVDNFIQHFQLMPELKQRLAKWSKVTTQQSGSASRELKSDEEFEYIFIRMKASLGKMLYGTAAYYQILNQQDLTFQRAVNVMQSAEYDLIISGHPIQP